MDSIKVVRDKHMDSIKLVRKKRTDSLAKVKADKEKLAKANEKKKEDALKFKMELKIKQKHEAWTNKSMLKRRWSPFRRLTQNSFTHYNYYYNSNKKMDEALVNMQRQRKENYDSLIGLYPFNPNKDPLRMMSADMDSIIRKVSIGIQIHDPRVKWSNDLYLLLARLITTKVTTLMHPLHSAILSALMRQEKRRGKKERHLQPFKRRPIYNRRQRKEHLPET